MMPHSPCSVISVSFSLARLAVWMGMQSANGGPVLSHTVFSHNCLPVQSKHCLTLKWSLPDTLDVCLGNRLTTVLHKQLTLMPGFLLLELKLTQIELLLFFLYFNLHWLMEFP